MSIQKSLRVPGERFFVCAVLSGTTEEDTHHEEVWIRTCRTGRHRHRGPVDRQRRDRRHQAWWPRPRLSSRLRGPRRNASRPWLASRLAPWRRPRGGNQEASLLIGRDQTDEWP